MLDAWCTCLLAERSPRNEAGRPVKAIANALPASARLTGSAPVATKASRAWLSTSKPPSATREGGKFSTSSPAKIATSGCIRLSIKGCFTFPWVRIAKFVTSDPEPEVVGMATNFTGSPAKYTIAFAVSRALPPPNAISRSGFSCRKTAVPSAASSTVGSGCMPSNTWRFSACTLPPI